MNRNMQAINWALEARGISPTAFRLLVQLCAFVNSHREDFEVWPSHKRLAEAVEISVSGVKRHLKELEESQLIEKRPGFRDDGGSSSNVYSIMVDTELRMPGGRRVKVKAPPAQSERPPAITGEQRWGVTADLCNEPLEEGTSERRNIPPLPTEEEPPSGENDLFGLPAVIEESPDDALLAFVLQRWNELVDRIPGGAKIQVVNDARRKAIIARGKEGAKSKGSPLAAWETVFENVEASSYLCGEDPPGRNYTEPFNITIDYVLRQSQFLKILEGGYRANRNASTHDSETGRRYGPAEQAGRAEIARIRAAYAQPGDGGGDGRGSQADGPGSDQGRPMRSAFDKYRT